MKFYLFIAPWAAVNMVLARPQDLIMFPPALRERIIPKYNLKVDRRCFFGRWQPAGMCVPKFPRSATRRRRTDHAEAPDPTVPPPNITDQPETPQPPAGTPAAMTLDAEGKTPQPAPKPDGDDGTSSSEADTERTMILAVDEGEYYTVPFDPEARIFPPTSSQFQSYKLDDETETAGAATEATEATEAATESAEAATEAAEATEGAEAPVATESNEESEATVLPERSQTSEEAQSAAGWFEILGPPESSASSDGEESSEGVDSSDGGDESPSAPISPGHKTAPEAAPDSSTVASATSAATTEAPAPTTAAGTEAPATEAARPDRTETEPEPQPTASEPAAEPAAADPTPQPSLPPSAGGQEPPWIEGRSAETLESSTDESDLVSPDGAPSTGLSSEVSLDDVYRTGVRAQLARPTGLISRTMDRSLEQVFLKARQVKYRLGQHMVSTLVANLTVSGMDSMKILEMSSDLEDMALNVTFEFPEIRLSGHFNATGSISGLKKENVPSLRTSFPSYGHGDIEAVIASTIAVSRAELGHSVNDRKLAVELLICNVTFGDPEVTLSNVWIPRVLKKLSFERLFRLAMAKMMQHQLTAEIQPSMDAALHKAITSALDRVTLDRAGADDYVKLAAGAQL